ncbi:MAG: DUF2163 domain-containing protein [Sterolibacterium sp.]|jgi:uncharacterized phage protein (TIGR02218 family)
MKAASAPLIELLGSGRPFMMADCYTFTLAGGTVLRYTSFDITLTFGSTTWSSAGPILQRGNTRTVIGLAVDTLDIKISPRDTDLIGAQSWFQAACSGALDGAVVTLHRAFLEAPPTVVGVLNMFVGTIAPITIDRMTIEVTCNSPLELLNTKLPRNLYQAGCQHTLFDTGCGLSPAAFDVAGSVTGAPTRTGFTASMGEAAGWFDLGALQFTSGVLSGTRRSVKRWNGGDITLLNPLPIAPAIGDTFTVWPGCDRLKATCESAKFSNVVNFKGYPFIPVPETAL